MRPISLAGDLVPGLGPDIVPSDPIAVACGECGNVQDAPGGAGGYTCWSCGTPWRVRRCRSCLRASVVRSGSTACARCGHDQRVVPVDPVPAWVEDPTPLGIWLGGVKYLGGRRGYERPVLGAGLLFDRRGIHVRAFHDVFRIPWSEVRAVGIEAPEEISQRLSMGRLASAGAAAWTLRVSYLTVETTGGAPIFEVAGLNSPQLRAKLARVLQAFDRPPSAALVPSSGGATRGPAVPESPNGSDADAPVPILVVDALCKLARLRELGLLDAAELRLLRGRLLGSLDRAVVPVPAEPESGGATGELLPVASARRARGRRHRAGTPASV